MAKILSAAIIFLLPCFVVAQTPDSCLERSVVVNVSDGKWHSLSNLKANNFTAKIGNSPVEVVSLTPRVKPKRLVVLLDTSGSMEQRSGSGKLPVGLKLAEQLVALSPKGTDIGFYTFADNLLRIMDVSDSPEALKATLESLLHDPPKAAGRTALIDAVFKVVSGIKDPGAEDLIYVITDGGDSSSKRTQKDLERMLLETRVRMAGLLLFDYLGTTPEEEAGPGMLREVVELSGGTLSTVEARDFTKLSRSNLAINIMGQLIDGYELQFKLPHPIQKPEKWKLELTDVPPELKKRFWIAYPPKLGACASESH